MSDDDPYLDDFDDFDERPRFDPDGEPPPVGEQLAFGEVMYPWRTPGPYDGPQPPMPRRPELLGDMEDAWWADVTAWTEWAIATFRLGKWFPPCWLRHSALVEEAQALWLVWCEAWMPGVAPVLPAQFLSYLAAALGRIETLWQIPCRADNHSEPAPLKPPQRLRPPTREWWSMPEFDPAAAVW